MPQLFNLVKKAIKNKANYIAIGAFNSSKTKKVKFKSNMKLLKIVKKLQIYQLWLLVE